MDKSSLSKKGDETLNLPVGNITKEAQQETLQCVLDFIKRVSSAEGQKSEAEIQLLPMMIEIILRQYC